jgi:hypothetical protein
MRAMKYLTRAVRCVDGRAMRHDPQPDDPYLETDIGRCEECEGAGCGECDACGYTVGHLNKTMYCGIETRACDKCMDDDLGAEQAAVADLIENMEAA